MISSHQSFIAYCIVIVALTIMAILTVEEVKHRPGPTPPPTPTRSAVLLTPGTSCIVVEGLKLSCTK